MSLRVEYYFTLHHNCLVSKAIDISGVVSIVNEVEGRVLNVNPFHERLYLPNQAPPHLPTSEESGQDWLYREIERDNRTVDTIF